MVIKNKSYEEKEKEGRKDRKKEGTIEGRKEKKQMRQK